MKKYQGWNIGTGLLTGLCVCGCFQPPPSATKTPVAVAPPATTPSPESEMSPEQVLGRRVRQALDLVDPQGAGRIMIEVHDGVVTLRGTAQDMRAAWRAVAAAQSVPGVHQVNNQLLVNTP